MIPNPPIGRLLLQGRKPFRVEYPYGRPGDGFRQFARPGTTTCVAYHEGVDTLSMLALRAGNEYRYGRDDPRFASMVSDMRENGFRGGDGQRLIVRVDGDDAWIAEGNHRLRAAIQAGLTEVEVEIRYVNGADESGLVIPFDIDDPEISVVSD